MLARSSVKDTKTNAQQFMTIIVDNAVAKSFQHKVILKLQDANIFPWMGKNSFELNPGTVTDILVGFSDMNVSNGLEPKTCSMKNHH